LSWPPSGPAHGDDAHGTPPATRHQGRPPAHGAAMRGPRPEARMYDEERKADRPSPRPASVGIRRCFPGASGSRHHGRSRGRLGRFSSVSPESRQDRCEALGARSSNSEAALRLLDRGEPSGELGPRRSSAACRSASGRSSETRSHCSRSSVSSVSSRPTPAAASPGEGAASPAAACRALLVLDAAASPLLPDQRSGERSCDVGVLTSTLGVEPVSAHPGDWVRPRLRAWRLLVSDKRGGGGAGQRR
jgi:hypothetical protein